MLGKSIIKYLKKRTRSICLFSWLIFWERQKKYVSTCIQSAVESNELHYIGSKYLCVFFPLISLLNFHFELDLYVAVAVTRVIKQPNKAHRYKIYIMNIHR